MGAITIIANMLLLLANVVNGSSVLRNLSHPNVIFCILSRDIVRGSQDVKWESIKGLENAKRLLKEAVVMPIKYPK